MFPVKTTITIGAFVALSAVMPHGVRSAQLRSTLTLIQPSVAPVIAPVIPKPLPVPALPVPFKAEPDTTPAPVIPNLEVPPGSLDAFFASLQKKGVTRILHYGDSPATADSITSDVRRLLQQRFGDAGHGFVLIAKPWAWYGHNGIKLDAKGWEIAPASQKRAPDGFHGLGGVSFRGEPGAVSTVTLPDTSYSGVTIHYLEQPGGGAFALSSNDTDFATISTAGAAKTPAFKTVALPEGTRAVQLRVTSGAVRLFGYRFDKDQPGVQYSSLGINGAQVQMLLRYFEPGQWREALRHEDPGLVVLNYGTNESIFPAYVEKQYPDELRKVIGRVREALPHSSILLMAPMDRGIIDASGQIVTPPILKTLIGVQRQIAAETGCAFFDTFDAMGGDGTMARWYHSEPRLVSADFMHPLPAGAAEVGALFEEALVKAYSGSPYASTK